jgi:hypothetical protein
VGLSVEEGIVPSGLESGRIAVAIAGGGAVDWVSSARGPFSSCELPHATISKANKILKTNTFFRII